ncbi:YeiH family protein [Candidatus Formimonas warabiya]|uniref:Uncharacterized protein n=1 Tax=Formimonas warabiya TaxID=1761012 RepID=A0A3G1KY38_FORW1|nr:YeiH family protein [Candidatus Formimonas warabiya]ATW27361.1 hypothetical protein DCMF_23725 [Candidatus Formimonas warabiya]
MKIKESILPGMLLTAGLAGVSFWLQRLSLISFFHLNSLIIAIILGMVMNNVGKVPAFLEPGITYSFKKILRIAIIFLGFKLSLSDMGQIGGKGIFLVIVVTAATLMFTLWLGKRLGLDRNLAVLIGAGSSICGASAIAAVAPVIDADDQDITFAVATVTIFGTLAMFLYPVFYHVFHLPDVLYAVWAGSSIHEVAQVVAAGFAAGEKTGQFATLVKLTRVLLVIPTVLLLGFSTVKKGGENPGFRKGTFPWFVFGFSLVVLINSFSLIPKQIVDQFVTLDSFLLTMAMAGLGLGANYQKLKRVGLKPLYAGLCISVFISFFSFVLSDWFFS